MNIYWPIYKNLESEFTKLMYNIHIDDNQLNVYSSKISDLILRAAIEIESISKELYKLNGGTKLGHIRYDDDALDFLNSKWDLDKKTVIISSSNCFQTNKCLSPFVKNEVRTGRSNMTYSWNNAYQNIKHDRASSLNFGSIKYLFDILSALYLLNLYFSNKTIPLEKDSKGIGLSPNIGSEIFSIEVYTYFGYDEDNKYIKNSTFNNCVYYIDITEDTAKVFFDSIKIFQKKINELSFQNEKVIEFLKTNDSTTLKPNWGWEVMGQEEYINVLRQAQRMTPIASEQMKYEARLNLNDR
jgi:hypothetical protein